MSRLTVEEHLVFYAELKNERTNNKVERKNEIDEIIEDLGLSDRRNEFSHCLSGGMKRKLSIGSAFIGNSKYFPNLL